MSTEDRQRRVKQRGHRPPVLPKEVTVCPKVPSTEFVVRVVEGAAHLAFRNGHCYADRGQRDQHRVAVRRGTSSSTSVFANCTTAWNHRDAAEANTNVEHRLYSKDGAKLRVVARAR